MHAVPRHRALISLLAGVVFPVALVGQTPAPEKPEEPKTPDVIVLDAFTVTTSSDIGYYSAYTTSATRTNELVKNTPISLTTINAELKNDLMILNDEDVARVTSSVTRDPDGFSFNQVRIRGFRSLTQRYDLFWREIERDGYNIDRVDIVKGANSLIYGQADPGGKVNSIPKKAVFGRSFTNASTTVGTKDFFRAELDANISVGENFAVRAMAFTHDQDYEQLYKTRQLRGATLELGYRLGKNTQLRAHLERIDLKQNLPPAMFFDATAQQRFAANSLADESATQRTASLTSYRNEFIYNPDAVDYLPEEIIADLELVGNANPTREQIKALYRPWTDFNALYSAHGPDKYNDRVGDIVTLDLTHKFTDDLQFKVAFNREDDDRNALTREGFSGSRVVGPVGGEYINAHWQKISGRTVANALKATMLWEKEVNLPLIGQSRHNLLLGYDWDQLRKNNRTYDQVKTGTTLYDGNYYSTQFLKEPLYLANGFGPSAPNVRYNGLDNQFQLRTAAASEVVTDGFWAALQSQFFNGRLRSLAGIRYDRVNIDHSYVDHVISVAPGYFTNPAFVRPPGLTPETINVEFADNNVKYDQVSPSIGALYWIRDGFGVYANYAKSIQSPTGVDLDPFGTVIPPVYGEGYEYGIRFELLKGKLNGQIAVFSIEKENDNVVNYDFRLSDIITYEKYGALYPNYFYYDSRPASLGWKLQNDALPGKQVAGDISRAEGVDVEFYYNPDRNISVVFSYTYNNLDAIRINENVNPRFGRIFGLAPHMAIVHFRYKFDPGPLGGLSLGFSQSYRSSSVIGSYYIDDNGKWFDVEMDEELSTDGFIRYATKIGKRGSRANLSFTYRASNIFDASNLMNRNRSASYPEPLRHMLEVSLGF